MELGVRSQSSIDSEHGDLLAMLACTAFVPCLSNVIQAWLLLLGTRQLFRAPHHKAGRGFCPYLHCITSILFKHRLTFVAGGVGCTVARSALTGVICCCPRLAAVYIQHGYMQFQARKWDERDTNS
jgi:hypothetical protein